MKILTADWLLPISAAPVERGAVVIENEKILAAGARSELFEKFPQAMVEDFGEAAILPGFINCHSHLELTAMRGFLDDCDEDFYSWLIKLTKTRGERLTEDDIEISAVFGALEGAGAGVTFFADIGRFGRHGLTALRQTGLRGIVFQETEFSPDNRAADEDFLRLLEKFLGLKEDETRLVRVGLSPHAPYTVSARLFEKIADYAISEDVKITVHAAESTEEHNLLTCGEGFFASVYEQKGLNWQTPRCSSIEHLARIGVLEAKPLLAHCVKVSDNDIRLIAESGSRIAHCPKSNAKFGHGIAPLEKFLTAGVRTGLGTDSVGSNNTCDILEEARFAALLARNSDCSKRFLSAREIIETATLGAARALGLDDEIGSIEAGKQADLTVVSLESVAQQPVHDVHTALLFASNARDVRLTMVAGEEVYRDGRSPKIDVREIKTKMREIGRKMTAE